MIDREFTFVLGAQDPEMREIERVVTRAGRGFLHAAREHLRCSPGNAYEADSAVLVGRDNYALRALLLPDAPIVTVECGLPKHRAGARVDHHHPGDPGYAKRPAEYLEGSSLGQASPPHIERFMDRGGAEGLRQSVPALRRPISDAAGFGRGSGDSIAPPRGVTFCRPPASNGQKNHWSRS